MVLCIYFWSENNLRMYKAVICDFYLEKYQLNSEENQTLKCFQTFGCDCIDIIHASWENYKFEICTKCLHNLNSRLQKTLCNLVDVVAKVLVHLKLSVSPET